MRRDTIFRIASMTKPVIAAATMMLVEECKLRLDDPVDAFLPELADRQVLKSLESAVDDTVPAKRSITTRDLLTFTFGMGAVMVWPARHPIQKAAADLGLAPGPFQLDLTADEFMKRLGTLPLIYQPGERWLYHTGSDVLGVLIARVSGQSLEAFLQERLFAPLGMRDTGFHVPAAKLDRLASAYLMDPQKKALAFFDDAGQQPLEQAAAVRGRRLGAGLDGGRLPRLRPHAAERRRARTRAHPVAADGRADDHRPAHRPSRSRARSCSSATARAGAWAARW